MLRLSKAVDPRHLSALMAQAPPATFFGPPPSVREIFKSCKPFLLSLFVGTV